LSNQNLRCAAVTIAFWLLLLVVATALFVPHVGLVAAWRRRTAAQAREAAENAHQPDRIRIVHIEDEPALAVAQMAALGLHRGQSARVLDSAPTRTVAHDGEQESVLAPMLAGNVHVDAALPTVEPVEAVVRLSELGSGRLGEVVALDPACRGFMRRRLLDLGFTPGAHVRPDLTTFAGDPRAYRVRGTTIALRNDQSARVLVRAVA
jgi:DtxR family transcriptional regulator, Mn-dependent transcriptional regulator